MKVFYIRCACHIVNLYVQDELKVINDFLT